MQAPTRAADVACPCLRASFCGLPPPITSAAALQLGWPHAHGSRVVPLLSEEQTSDQRGQGLVQLRAGWRFRPEHLCVPWAVSLLLPDWDTGGPEPGCWGPWGCWRCACGHRVHTCSQTPLSPTRGLDEPWTALQGAETTQPSLQPRRARDLHPAPPPAPCLQPCRLGLPQG